MNTYESKAQKGQGATISVSADEGTTWTEVKEVKTVEGIGGGTSSVKDVTHLKSKAKEKRPGLKDEGSVTIGGNYIEDDAGQLVIQEARNNSTVLKVKIELDNAKTETGNGTTFSFDATAQTFKISNIAVDEYLSFETQLDISGAVEPEGAK